MPTRKDAACWWIWVGALAILVTGLVWSMSPTRLGAAELQMAPQNPAFTEYLRNKELGLLRTLSDDGYPLAFLPSPIRLPTVTSRARLMADDSLPSAFDLRSAGGGNSGEGPGGVRLVLGFCNFCFPGILSPVSPVAAQDL